MAAFLDSFDPQDLTPTAIAVAAVAGGAIVFTLHRCCASSPSTTQRPAGKAQKPRAKKKKKRKKAKKTPPPSPAKAAKAAPRAINSEDDSSVSSDGDGDDDADKAAAAARAAAEARKAAEAAKAAAKAAKARKKAARKAKKAAQAQADAAAQAQAEDEDDGWVVAGKKEADRRKKKDARKRAASKEALSGGQMTVKVNVPARKIGVIIGPKGATINAIRDATGCEIDMPERGGDASPGGGGSRSPKGGSSAVTLTGSAAGVDGARLAIKDLVAKGYCSYTRAAGDDFVEQQVSVHSRRFPARGCVEGSFPCLFVHAQSSFVFLRSLLSILTAIVVSCVCRFIVCRAGPHRQRRRGHPRAAGGHRRARQHAAQLGPSTFLQNTFFRSSGAAVHTATARGPDPHSR